MTFFSAIDKQGLYIGFEQMEPDAYGAHYFRTFLINHTQSDLLVLATLMAGQDRCFEADLPLSSLTAAEVGVLHMDDLNRSPVLTMRCSRLTSSGQREHMSKELKIRPKTFFKNLQLAPCLHREMHVLLVADTWNPPLPTEERLTEYALRHQKKPPVDREDHPFSRIVLPGIEEVARFQPEIDLHIERLAEPAARLSNGEIIRIQMRHFEQFMDKAIRLGVPRVFIIHGVGEGKLRQMIAARLMQYPQVAHFKNEYHHKYGYGATEVIFELMKT